MGPIQSAMNQSLAILSLASSQNPQAQANRQATADTKTLDTISKTELNYGKLGTQEQLDMFLDAKEEAIKSNVKAGRINTAADIKTGNYFKNTGMGIGELSSAPVDYSDIPYTARKYRTSASKAVQESNNKLSNKQRIKVNMNMMKSTLKEDN